MLGSGHDDVVLGRCGARIGMKQTLFDKGEAVHPSPGEVAAAQTMGGNPRLRVPQRNQVEIRWASLDELLEPDHPSRRVRAFVCGLDLGRWLTTIKGVEGVAGRDATDPRLLVALWIYATIEGVGSARELERLCEKHLAYQWLCGGVSVNYHLLSDFRSRSGDQWAASASGTPTRVGGAATTLGRGHWPLRPVAAAA